jgi:hypothetical protein
MATCYIKNSFAYDVRGRTVQFRCETTKDIDGDALVFAKDNNLVDVLEEKRTRRTKLEMEAARNDDNS